MTRRLLLALGAAILLGHLLLPRADLRKLSGETDRFLDGRSLGAHPARAEPGFRDAATNAPVPAAARAVFAFDDTVRDRFQGTYIEYGDAWTGTLRGEAFTVDAPFLYLPVTGFPATAGNRLELCLLDAAGNVTRRLVYGGGNPREAVRLWEVDARGFQGATARVEMTDGLTAPGGWLGVGRPLLGERGGLGGRGPGDFGVGGTTGAFWAGALVIASLLWVPGAVLSELRRRMTRPAAAFSFGDAAWLALPGLLGLSAFGLALWLTGSGPRFFLGQLYVATVMLMALAGALRRPAAGTIPGGGGGLALGLYAVVVLVVLQYSAVPLTVDQEFRAGTNLRGRMVCSPPDNAIPFETGDYFFHGYDGKERVGSYLGGWTLTSRGPLAPLGIMTLWQVFGIVPPDPPATGEYAWPADEQGVFVARIFGVLTNALAVLAIAALAARAAPAGRGRAAGTFALAWAALCPLVFVNTAFVWPKLLAATFALLAAEGVLAGAGAWRVGGLLALGYYSHPVGALLVPGVIALRAAFGGTTSVSSAFPEGAPVPKRRTTRRSSLRGLIPAAGVAAAFVACLLPWLLFKRHLGGTEPFARYPLGDGRGELPALGVGSWALARARNVYYTLMPAGFQLANDFPDWLGEPLRGAKRWNLAYAKSLPGHLGYGAFWIAYAAALGWGGRARLTAAARRLRTWTVWATFAGMVLIWGFNADGLGRACLEGVSPFALALGAAWAAGAWGGVGGWRLGGAVLGIVGAETGWVMFSGFVVGERFHGAGLPAGVRVQLGALGLTWAGLIALALLAWRRAVMATGAVIRVLPPRAGVNEGPGAGRAPRLPPEPSRFWQRGGLPNRTDARREPIFGHPVGPGHFPIPRAAAPRPVVIPAAGPGRGRWPTWTVPVLTLLVLAAILALRRPGALTRPGFWAEDAVVFFNGARADGLWATLFRPYPGYLVVGERLVAWAASLGPAVYAPGIYAWTALAAHLGVGALLMRPRLRSIGGGPALALMTALVPHDGEAFLRLLGLYWLAAPVLWVLILQDAPRTRRGALGDFALLLAAGLTGPFAIIFLPLFLARPWREGWTVYNRALLGLALAVAAVQGWGLAHFTPAPHPGPTWEPRPWLEAALIHLPGGLLGGDALTRLLGPLAWGFGTLVIIAAAWLMFRAGERRWRVPAAVLALGGLTAWAGGMAQHGWIPAMLTASGIGGRYFYPAAIAAAWVALLLCRDRAPLVRLGGGVALALLLLASVTGTFRIPTKDLHWPDYARRIDAGEAGVVAPIEPGSWTLVPVPRRGAGPPLGPPRTEGEAFRPDGAYVGANWLEAGPHPAVWGSWNAAAGGDDATGELVFGPFPAPGRFLMTVSGFPNSGGNGLTVRRVSDRSERRLAAFDPMERWTEFVVTTPASWGNEPVEIVARDAATGPGGWMGLSAPYQRSLLGGVVLPVGEGPPRFLPMAWRRDARIVGAFAVNALLILLPGLALLGPVRRRLGGNVISDSFAPLLVFALSVAVGYAVFFVYRASPAWGTWTSIGVCLLSAGTCHVGRRRLWANLGGREAGWAGALTLLAAVLALGILLLPRAGGDGVAALAARRFMGGALPPDNLLPEIFTAKLAAGQDTRMLLGDWLGSDRPPLGVGWGLLARPVAWALGPGGEAADQTAGMLFQLAWVPAAWALARAAGLARGRAAQVVAGIVPSGFLCLNTVYIWPKLSAAAFAGGAFVLLAQGRNTGGNLSAGRAAAGGALAALGYLSGGAVMFSLLAVAGMLLFWPGLWPGWRRTLTGAAAAGLLCLPWQSYVKLLNPPGDRLLKWHLGGVLDPADPRRAGETIRDAYLKTPPGEIVAMKFHNALSLFRGDYQGLADLRGGKAAETRQTEDFFHVARTLGVWNVGWFIGLGLLLWRLMRRQELPPTARELGRVAGAVFGGLAVWVLLYFNAPGFTTLDIHYGSYLVLTQALVLLAAILRETGGGLFAVVAGVNALLFLTTYARVPTRFGGGVVDALAAALVGLAVIGLTVAAVRARDEVDGDAALDTAGRLRSPSADAV